MTTMTGIAADWRSAGACLHADPDLFFPVPVTGRALKQIAKAKAVCAACPVRVQCLEFAQVHYPVDGVWGGTTAEDRQKARREEQRAVRARPRPAAA